jgi:transcription elongation factor GreA-like protein
MANETMINKISGMLHEEKWTRTALTAYTVNDIKELDQTLAEVKGQDTMEEIKQLAEEHLQESKNSIIALFFQGFISLKLQLLDDSNLFKLINLFKQNQKLGVVEYISQRILDYGEHKLALRTLIDCLKGEEKAEEVFPFMERLVKIDMEEADMVLALAYKAEDEGDSEKAVDYFKKAIHRFIFQKNYNKVKEIWSKIVTYEGLSEEYYFQIEQKVARTMGNEKAALLLEELYPVQIQEKKYESAIESLLRIYDYDNKNTLIRREIITCLENLYDDKEKTQEYIRLSNIQQNWKSLPEALEDFKKRMAYEKGNFVLHKAWGVGIIQEVEGDSFIISFEKKRNQKITQKMAVEILNSLPKDDFRVIKAKSKKDILKKKVKKDPKWALTTIIKSFDNSADMKLVKSVLVPSVLTDGEWSSWSSNARSMLKTDEIFANSPDKLDSYTVRKTAITKEEKIYNKFKAEKTIFTKISTFKDFLDLENLESEYFPEMLEYFVGILKMGKVDQEVIAAYITVEQIIQKYPYLNPGINKDFLAYWEEIENLEDLFVKIESAEVRKVFLSKIKKNVPNWQEIFARLFPYSLSKVIIDELLEDDKNEIVNSIFGNLFDRYKDQREAFLWVAKYLYETDFAGYEDRLEKVLINLIHLLDLTMRDIENKKDVSDNKKYNKQIKNILFKEGHLETYLKNANESSLGRIFALLEDVRGQIGAEIQTAQNIIVERFPKFQFGDAMVIASESKAARSGILATLTMFNAKQKELQHILDVEVKQNSEEIGKAIALGDLKENAEYHAAKEKTSHSFGQRSHLAKRTLWCDGDRKQIG